ncbi:MAG TPA: hypothetical protein VFS21_13795 [Roseiflexaceae bacterium]|nr:hypothetical protein [Roseiflexaceae bacterium]
MIATADTRSEGRWSARHLAPVFCLYLLAPLVGEFLLGNIPISSLALLLLLAPLYGGGAVLIRETARRWGLGWPSIVVFCLVYGLIEEAFVTQSLFNPNFVGQRLLDYGYIDGMGISSWWTTYVLSLHALWSTAVPIALVESFAPRTRTTPWLGTLGLMIVAFLYVAVCVFLFFFQSQELYIASTWQYLGGAIACVLLSALAFALARVGDTLPRSSQPAPAPRVVGASSFVIGSAFMILAAFVHSTIPAALNVAGLLALLVFGGGLVWRWSRQTGWSALHQFAVAAGLLLVYVWFGFVQVPSIGGTNPSIDLIGNVVFACGALALVALGVRRVRAEDRATA